MQRETCRRLSTPALCATDTLGGLLDRALIGLTIYTFAWVSA